jgi:cell division protease FtsH
MFPGRNNNQRGGRGGGGGSFGPGQSQRNPWTTIIWIIVLVFAGYLIFNLFFGRNSGQVEVSYSTFRQYVQNDQVKSVTIKGNEITGTLNKEVTGSVLGSTQDQTYTSFYTYVPAVGDPTLLPLMEAYNVEIVSQPQSGISIGTILLYLLPTLLIGVFVYWIFRQMANRGSGVISVGKSQAKLYDKKGRITFNDVAVSKNTKNEFTEVIGFLKSPSHFQRLGGEMPKGVLLVGPPGTGKTLIARAVAGEADVPFFSITGSNFMEMFVGVGAARVRDMFDNAKKVAPSIIFIDELDSIGRHRGAGIGGGHDEREQTLNQLLSEMDGFEKNDNVILMAATNRPDILDPALLRPGRFDRIVAVDLPTLNNRIAILQIHARNKPLAEDVDFGKIARSTPGFSGADLENLLNEAALLAARRGKQKIEWEDIEDSRDKVVLGLKRENISLTDEEIRMLAYHESGHSIVAMVLPHADPIFKVTIVPRGQSMGVTQQLPERDRYLYDREYAMDRLAVMLGGRVAERTYFGTLTSGAEADLKQATQLARKMILDWGMSERLGFVAYGDRRQQVFLGEQIAQGRDYSEQTAREIDEEVKTFLQEASSMAKNVIKNNREGLERLVDALIEKEELAGEEVVRILKEVGIEKKKEGEYEMVREVEG